MKISLPQIIVSAVAAVVAALVASFFGVTGTVVGVAVGSAVATAGTAVFRHSIERTNEVVRQVVAGSPTADRLIRPLGRTRAAGAVAGPEHTTSGPPTRIDRSALTRRPYSPSSGTATNRPTGVQGRHDHRNRDGRPSQPDRGREPLASSASTSTDTGQMASPVSRPARIVQRRSPAARARAAGSRGSAMPGRPWWWRYWPGPGHRRGADRRRAPVGPDRRARLARFGIVGVTSVRTLDPGHHHDLDHIPAHHDLDHGPGDHDDRGLRAPRPARVVPPPRPEAPVPAARPRRPPGRPPARRRRPCRPAEPCGPRSVAGMPSLYDVSAPELESLLAEEPPFRARQVWDGLHRRVLRPGDMTELPARPAGPAGQGASAGADRGACSPERPGSDGQVAVRPGRMGRRIETVLMTYRQRVTVCVSTQAGCAMGVRVLRDRPGRLHPAPTVGGDRRAGVEAAIRAARPRRLSNVVFMGMGEPLANYDRVWAAIERLHAPMGHLGPPPDAVDRRVVPGIRRLSGERLPVNLAVSLHAANDELRDVLVPINRRYPLAPLLEACARLRGGDGPSPLVRVGAHRRGQRPGSRCTTSWPQLAAPIGAHVNLIPLNPTPGYPVVGTPPLTGSSASATSSVARGRQRHRPGHPWCGHRRGARPTGGAGRGLRGAAAPAPVDPARSVRGAGLVRRRRFTGAPRSLRRSPPGGLRRAHRPGRGTTRPGSAGSSSTPATCSKKSPINQARRTRATAGAPPGRRRTAPACCR